MNNLLDSVDNYYKSKLESLKLYSDDDLRAEITRAFEGSFNPNFDLDKFCAGVILKARELGNN